MSYYGNPVGGVGGVGGCVSPVGYGGGCSVIGFVLVLFILLVIITRSVIF